MIYREGLRRQTRKWQITELINGTIRSKTVPLRSNSGSYLTLFTRSTNSAYLGYILVFVSSVCWGIQPLKGISLLPALTRAVSALSFSSVGFLEVFNPANKLQVYILKRTHICFRNQVRIFQSKIKLFGMFTDLRQSDVIWNPFYFRNYSSSSPPDNCSNSGIPRNDCLILPWKEASPFQKDIYFS